MSDDLTTHVGVGSDGELIEIHDPGSTGQEIHRMYAILSVDVDGEGIVGFKTPDGWVPMVHSQREGIENLYPIAREMAQVTQRQMKVVEFSTRTELDIINP